MNYKELQNLLLQCQQASFTKSYRQQPENVQILRVSSTNELITMKSYPPDYYESQEQLEQMITTLKMEKELSHQHLIAVINYYHGKEGLIVFTEHCSHTLLDQIQARRKDENYFSIEEIENLVISVVKALKYLEDNQIGHGCLSTVDIGISGNGAIKLIDPSLASNSPFDLTHGYYYSPELMKLNTIAVSTNPLESFKSPEIDFFKSDVFVLGMVLLHMGLLSDMTHCYNYNTGTLSMNKIRNNVTEFQELYGPQLTHLLNQMLSLDEDERITPDGILKLLEEQYDDSDRSSQGDEQPINSHQEQEYQHQVKYSDESCGEQMFPKASLEKNFESFNKENMYIGNPFPVKPRKRFFVTK